MHTTSYIKRDGKAKRKKTEPAGVEKKKNQGQLLGQGDQGQFPLHGSYRRFPRHRSQRKLPENKNEVLFYRKFFMTRKRQLSVVPKFEWVVANNPHLQKCDRALQRNKVRRNIKGTSASLSELYKSTENRYGVKVFALLKYHEII